MQVYNNLGTFKILYLVKGILTLCFSLFFMLYAGMGFFFGAAMELDPTNDAPFNPGIIFIIIGVIGIIFCVTLGVLTLLVSKYIKERRNYNFIFAMAIVNCLTGVLGILLGVFTLIELNKIEVKQLFRKTQSIE
ncbi:hypothetical protein FBALC1_05228 [Flavobacteriales bacterium ALC-1]|nr:hypothetical protein FBALC1_05228 [Flavobacteriales bacterium ALC-1]